LHLLHHTVCVGGPFQIVSEAFHLLHTNLKHSTCYTAVPSHCWPIGQCAVRWRLHCLLIYWGGKQIEVGLGCPVRYIWTLTSLSKHFMIT
jgi:hypothetical protein